MGSTLTQPILVWNDTLREGPRNPTYFGLTTPDDSSASFGVNCDVPGLYFRYIQVMHPYYLITLRDQQPLIFNTLSQFTIVIAELFVTVTRV